MNQIVKSKPFNQHSGIEKRKILSFFFICWLLWSASFTGISIGLKGFSPTSLALLRYGFASLTLLIYSVIVKTPLPKVRDIPAFFVMGFLSFTVYNVALNTGQLTVSAGLASIVIGIIPVEICILAYFFLGEKMTLKNAAGIPVAFLGLLITCFQSVGGLKIDSGILWVLLAGIAASVSTIIQKNYLKRYSGFQVMTYSIWTGTICMLIFAPGLVREIPAAPMESIVAAAFLGVFPGVIAYMAWGALLARIPAYQANSFLYLDPIGAMLIAGIILGEIPAWNVFLGFAVILVGLILVNGSGAKAPQPEL